MTLMAALVMIAGATALVAQDDAAEAPPAAKDLTVRPVGISVTLLDSDRLFGYFGEDSLAEDLPPGTALYFLVQAGGQPIMDVLAGESTIEAFTDDTGQALLASGPAKRDDGEGLRSVDANSKNTAVRFAVVSAKRPAEGATSLNLKASLVVDLRGEQKTATAENVSLANDATVEIAGYMLTIDDVEREDGETDLTFESGRNFSGLGEITFLDAEGNEIEAEDMGTGYMTANDVTTYNMNFELDGEHESVTIRVNYYEPVRVTAPVDVTVGLGL